MSGMSSVGAKQPTINNNTNVGQKPIVNNAPSLESVQKNGVVLKKGMSGESVEKVQTSLKSLGYNIEVTSKYDEATVKAVKKFQTDHGVKPTGNVGALTLARLDKFDQNLDETQFSRSTKPQASGETKPVDFVDNSGQTAPVNNAPTLDLVAKGKAALKKGMSGESVQILQEKLKKAGYEIDVNGTFDEKTEKALKAFQKDNHIKPTGQLGRFTLDALEEEEGDEDGIEEGNTTPDVQNPNGVDNTNGTDATGRVYAGGTQATPNGMKLAKEAEEVANEMAVHRNPKKGKCFRGVKNALMGSKIGVELVGKHAYMAAGQLAKSSKFSEVKDLKPADLKNLPPGAIVVWGKTAKSKSGHISIALGNGKEASDFIPKNGQLTSLRGYTNFRVFVPK
ncbi:MAG: peptidoglycan-binding domain-containing protein [Candidatus Sericytochromatia bacterium]